MQSPGVQFALLLVILPRLYHLLRAVENTVVPGPSNLFALGFRLENPTAFVMKL